MFGAEDTVLSYLPLCYVAEKLLMFLPLEIGAVVHSGPQDARSSKDAKEAPAQQEEHHQPEDDHDQRTMAMSL